MIRYAATEAEIEAGVNALDENWLTNAQTRTDAFVAGGRYDETGPIWSKVKPVFMALQYNKCIFCERQYENVEDYGKIEFDLEHFRPKSSVKSWPGTDQAGLNYGFPTGGADARGYYWLAYKLGNYAASCKSCNSDLKSNYFPVEGARLPALASPQDLLGELPLLCYPLGDWDEDPEALVTFVATTAVPAVQEESHSRRRGQVIIDLFQLNDREVLHRERARMIILLGGSLRNIEAGVDDPEDHELVNELATRPVYPHAGCLRAFQRLWDAPGQRPLAHQVLRACKAYVASQTGTPPPQIG